MHPRQALHLWYPGLCPSYTWQSHGLEKCVFHSPKTKQSSAKPHAVWGYLGGRLMIFNVAMLRDQWLCPVLCKTVAWMSALGTVAFGSSPLPELYDYLWSSHLFLSPPGMCREKEGVGALIARTSLLSLLRNSTVNNPRHPPAWDPAVAPEMLQHKTCWWCS